MRKFDLFRRNRNEHDKLLGKISLYILVVAILLILFEKLIGNLPAIGTSIATFFHYFNGLVSPFLMGFAIAYVMNPFMSFFERHFLKWFGFCRNHKKLTRTFCILLMYTLIIGGTVWILIYLIPEIRDSIMAFATNISVYSEAMNERIRHIFDQIPYIDSAEVNKVIDRFMEPIKHLSENAPEILETLAANAFIFGRLTLNFIMAIFIAFYMLYDKERFAKKMEKGVYAFSTEEKAVRFLYNAERIHHIFNDFIVGKAIDSLIIGILAFIVLTIMRAPFPLILALIIGVTNMIPYFGPFIGAIPAILITLLIDPPLAIAVAIFILVLQQFDGNFLGPKILGESVDLSPLWIILAVVVGGALMGPLGMFIGVPIFATVKVFGGEYINRLYWRKYSSTDPMNLSKKGTAEEEQK
ncbi:MAG: AI-2E family transporter [Anaerotignum sp.]|nr:AI-2E family transporter [Anaerotignum sp.]